MASYRKAIEWIVANDDTDWLDDGPDAAPSVTACLVADLFRKSDVKVRTDLVEAKRLLNAWE